MGRRGGGARLRVGTRRSPCGGWVDAAAEGDEQVGDDGRRSLDGVAEVGSGTRWPPGGAVAQLVADEGGNLVGRAAGAGAQVLEEVAGSLARGAGGRAKHVPRHRLDVVACVGRERGAEVGDTPQRRPEAVTIDHLSSVPPGGSAWVVEEATDEREEIGRLDVR